jgi:Flp pilus assembly protein TadG
VQWDRHHGDQLSAIGSRGRGLGQRSAGQSLVEFALVFPVLILVLVAVFDVGRLVFAYNDVTNAARTGARVAIVDQTANKARNAVIGQATSLGLTSSDITVLYLESDLSGACSPLALGCVVEITASFDWQAITPIVGSIVGPITVTTETRMPLERLYP